MWRPSRRQTADSSSYSSLFRRPRAHKPSPDSSGRVGALWRTDQLGYLFARTLMGRDIHQPNVHHTMQPKEFRSVPVIDQR